MESTVNVFCWWFWICLRDNLRCHQCNAKDDLNRLPHGGTFTFRFDRLHDSHCITTLAVPFGDPESRRWTRVAFAWVIQANASPETKWWQQKQTYVDRCTWSTSSPPDRMKWKRGQFERASRQTSNVCLVYGWSWSTDMMIWYCILSCLSQTWFWNIKYDNYICILYIYIHYIIWFLYQHSRQKGQRQCNCGYFLTSSKSKGCQQL